MLKTKQAHAGNEAYDDNFYRTNKENSQRRASIMLPLVNEYIHPTTVADVGCGSGGWLAVWQNNFGAEIYGIDGDYVDRKWLSIDEKFFHPFNLEERLPSNLKFDLVECLEVAEHLSPARADTFVEDLTKLSDVILFSAAIPGQGGTNHVNEQWQSYWVKKFLHYGYVCVDCIRPRIWQNSQIDIHYRNSTFIYVKSSALYRYPELNEYYLNHRAGTIYDQVHPEYWISRLIDFQNFCYKVQHYLANQQNHNDNKNISGGAIYQINNILSSLKTIHRRQKRRRFFVVPICAA